MTAENAGNPAASALLGVVVVAVGAGFVLMGALGWADVTEVWEAAVCGAFGGAFLLAGLLIVAFAVDAGRGKA